MYGGPAGAGGGRHVAVSAYGAGRGRNWVPLTDGDSDQLVCLSITSRNPAFDNWICTLRPAWVGLFALPQKLHL
jgi:hypothetical protein